MSDLILSVNGREYDSWKTVRIHKTMNAIAGSMALKTLDFFSGSPNKWLIKMGDTFTFTYKGNKLCTGYIENIHLDYDTTNYSYIFAGRDKTADLVDCNFGQTINEWINDTVLNIIKKLCLPFSITVKNDSQVSSIMSKKIESFKANEGETVFQSISRICNDFGLLPVSYGDGFLYLTASSSALNRDAIETGANVLSCSVNISDVDRYSQYIVKGVGVSTANKRLADYIEPSSTAIDSVMSRTRPLIIFADTPTDTGKCVDKAKWERQTRAGLSRKAVYRVLGWEQSNKAIWEINNLVRVKDGYRGIDDTYLISDIVYNYNDQEGYTVDIVVVHKDTYSTNNNLIKLEFDA